MKRGSQTARTAATTAGKQAGGQPAITALTAIFSTVASPRRGSTTPTTCAGAVVDGLEHRLHALRGRRDERQAVAPAARLGEREERLGVGGDGVGVGGERAAHGVAAEASSVTR